MVRATSATLKVVYVAQDDTVTVPRKPVRVGVDRYMLLLDLDGNDNQEVARIAP